MPDGKERLLKGLWVKNLLLTLGYFLFSVLLVGLAIIGTGHLVRGNIHWVAQHAVVALVLAIGLFCSLQIYDRTALRVHADERIRLATSAIKFGTVTVCVAVSLACFGLTVLLHAGAEEQTKNMVFHLPPSNFWPLFLSAIAFTGMVQPALEEVIFRGRILASAREAITFWPAALLVSGLFGLLHSSHMAGSFIFSMAMCILRKHKGLSAAIFAHSIYNMAAILRDAI